MEKFKTPSAVVVFLIEIQNGRKKILLQRRQNTGFGDGMWDLSCSGHVEYKESMTTAAVRECREELGVEINPQDLRFVTLIHKRDEECDKTYYNGYFYAEKFCGVPKICEPEKCSQLQWFYVDELPTDLLDDRKVALLAFLSNKPYIEYGWT